MHGHHTVGHTGHKWNHPDCVLQDLTSFTQHHLEIHPDWVDQQFVPLCCEVVSHYLATPCFVYHSPVDEHLGGFQFLAIRNKIFVNFHILVFVGICFHFSGVDTWKGTGGVLVLESYLSNYKWPEWLCSFTFLPTVCESCFTFLATLGIVSVLDLGHPP